MSWLNGWLKELILIILLASFIDLLLPSQAMQRYVRTVVGLFLLLVLLQPIFQWFQKGWDADKWLAAAEIQAETRRATAAANGKQQVASLSAIMEKSEELKRSNEQAAVKLTEQQLAQEIRADLEKTTGVSVVDVQVRTKLDNKGRPSIEKVEVVLSHTSDLHQGKDRGSASSPAPIGRVKVEEVKPVMIQIEPIHQERIARPSAESGEASPETERLKRDAIRQIEQQWNVSAERIAVTVRSTQQIGR